MTTVLPIRAAVFENETEANTAVVDLLAAGFPKETISVVSKHPGGDDHQHATAPAGVKEVASSGGHTRAALVWGTGIGGLLAGFTAVLFVSASSGEGLILAGTLLAAIIVGGIVGGFIGSMFSRGFEPAIADFHDQAMRSGQFLVAVEAGPDRSRIDAARAILARFGKRIVALRKG